MGKLRTGHLVEAGLWLGLCLFLYIYSFEFEKDIEIYKFGATAWPRAIILLMTIAALGQLFHHWKRGDEVSSEIIDAATHDDAEEAAHDAHHEDIKWYASTFGLLLIPFAYMRIPDWIVALLSAEGTTVHLIRIVCAAILIGIFIYYMRRSDAAAVFCGIARRHGFLLAGAIFHYWRHVPVWRTTAQTNDGDHGADFRSADAAVRKNSVRWFAGGQYTSVLRYR
jgi:hypothetical protein